MDTQRWLVEQRKRRAALRSRQDTSRASGFEPWVSVVVIAWNAERVLGRCLKQLLDQDYPNYEIIVVDDGSRDGTRSQTPAISALVGQGGRLLPSSTPTDTPPATGLAA
jgi:hypothetical protein